MQIDYFLYTSCLPEDADAGSVASIVKQARSLNAIAGITGVLGFDGECFVQYVEGPPEAVHALASALERDPRHTGFKIHTKGEFPLSERRFSTWQMGYADVGVDALNITTLSGLSGEAALGYFLNHAQALDFA